MFRAAVFSLLIFAVGPVSASYYTVDIRGQAIALLETNTDSYYFSDTDGATSYSYDTGLLTGISGRAGTAQSSASVNLATGTLRAYVYVTGDQTAQALAHFTDFLFFNLPDGLTQTEVTLSLLIEGVLSGDYSRNSAFPQSLSFGNQNAAPGVITDSLFLSAATLPETLSVTYTVKEGISYILDAAIGGGTSTPAGGFGLMDLSNTALLSIEMSEGVSFTSQSGVLLTAVPIPAAAWLFGSALLGLAAVKRKKA